MFTRTLAKRFSRDRDYSDIDLNPKQVECLKAIYLPEIWLRFLSSRGVSEKSMVTRMMTTTTTMMKMTVAVVIVVYKMVDGDTSFCTRLLAQDENNRMLAILYSLFKNIKLTV